MIWGETPHYFRKHPKMIIFSRKTHGCWVPPFSETPIFNIGSLPNFKPSRLSCPKHIKSSSQHFCQAERRGEDLSQCPVDSPNGPGARKKGKGPKFEKTQPYTLEDSHGT